ncbi:MAG: hypothetical protein ACRD3J_30135 [Thermoanaerobaculia bacterium]
MVTAFFVGTTDDFFAVFLRVGARRGEDLRRADFFDADLFDVDLFAEDFRPPDFFAAFLVALFGALLRPFERLALFFRAGDLRAEDLRALFFLAPPRDDFLAAAMIRAPM